MNPKIKKIPSESQEQQRFILKLRWLHPKVIFFAIPNGGKRSRSEARRMVLEGVEKGTPDVFIAEPRKKYSGLFIELKRAVKSVSKISKEQIEKKEALESKGYCVKVCYGAEEAYRVFLDYLSL